jgi:hypothetical protein
MVLVRLPEAQVDWVRLGMQELALLLVAQERWGMPEQVDTGEAEPQAGGRHRFQATTITLTAALVSSTTGIAETM